MAEIADTIVKLVGDAAESGRRGAARGFAEAALKRLPVEHLDQADVEVAVAALADAFAFVDGRQGESIAVRVRPGAPSVLGGGGVGTVVEASAEDRPFLMSTITAELDLRDLTTARILHPIIGVDRGADGRIASILPARESRRRESYVRAELEEELTEDEARDLEQTIERLLADVLRATGDFSALRDRLARAIAELDAMAADAYPRREVDEAMALLSWFLDDNLLLLGWREYELVEGPDGPRSLARVVPGSGLGILRDVTSSRYAEPVPLSELPGDLRERLTSGPLVTVSRTNRRSTVRQRERMDYVGIRKVDAEGNVAGEMRLLGLFTRKGLSEPSRSTPILRRKLEEVLEREDIVRASHDERMLTMLFQALPKDELFQSSVDELQATLMGLLQAEERKEVRTLVRIEPFTRTVSVLVAVPRDRYSPQLRRQLTALFRERFNGERVEVDLSLGERAEAIARFSVEVPGSIPEIDREALGREVRDLARSWVDELTDRLVAERGEDVGGHLADLAERLPRAYQDVTPLGLAVDDVTRIDALLADLDRGLDVRFVREPGATMTRLRVVRPGERLELSAFLPIVESLGLTVVEEVPHHSPALGLTLHDFGVRDDLGLTADLVEASDRLADSILAAWRGQLELDELNRLVADAGLTWRQVNVLRAYRRYRRQVGTAYTPQYINETLADHPGVAKAIVELFEAKFEPMGDDEDATAWGQRTARVDEARRACLAAVDEVERLDQDRILRDFVALVDATLRTNAFRADALAEQASGTMVPYLAFKFDSALVPDAPQPVPHREIFVFSPAVEGIHLRGGPVARGGLRWSDRRDDFRTEVLGLMKAQVSKNSVIVPTGAKGGFVLKRQVPADELREEVARQYVTFIRALLDVTDNIVGGEIVPPPDVVRHDGDDPYLVVAADKGTATFSDTANAVADEYGFWLGDAFASGGSKGYDHKKLGITARGAWVAVRQHFTELGVDVQTEPVRVVGIGDMSGDVFGNGMLLSRAIKLVAAFDHRDIFLDPDPDPEASFAERERLFALPRSSWQDYDRAMISAGGGVFSRSAKSIPLSPEVRELLRVDATELSPPELMKAILRAPADLFWAGGIGTYVKASHETHADVGDRTNDELRIDADQLRVRVVGEGANLSFTQSARIQYARRGGRINMDAVDNVAGVDSSDHEVNVKILLRLAVEQGRVSLDERDQLLEEVTEDVVAHVLRDVELQARRLSLELRRAPSSMHAYERLMVQLEDLGILHRHVEYLPDTATMRERADAGAGLTRPELAVLLAYAKRVLTARILESDLPDEPAVQVVLDGYFPRLLVSRFGDLLPEHRLRRELVATIIANDLANRMGVTFAFEAARHSGRSVAEVATAYWAAREVSYAERQHERIEELAGQMPPERNLDVALRVHELVSNLTHAYLSGTEELDISAIVAREAQLLVDLSANLPQLGTEAQRMARQDHAARLVDDLVEPELARFLASTDDLAMVPSIAHVAEGRDGTAVADAFLRVDDALGIKRLQDLVERAEATTRWQREQRQGLVVDLAELRAGAVQRAFDEHPEASEAAAVQAFLADRGARLTSVLDLLRDIEAAEAATLDGLAVVSRAIRRVVERR